MATVIMIISKFQKYLGSVSDNKFDTRWCSLQQLHGLLMVLTLNTDTIDTKELISPLEPPVSVCHAPGNYPTDVDGGVLLLTAHYTKTKENKRINLNTPYCYGSWCPRKKVPFQ